MIWYRQYESDRQDKIFQGAVCIPDRDTAPVYCDLKQLSRKYQNGKLQIQGVRQRT